MRSEWRRAVFLIELLPVMLAVAVGGTLMTISIASILRSQKRVAELSNRYAILSDFLRCFRQDVRAGTELTLAETGGDAGDQVLFIGGTSGRIAYRFLDQTVERAGYEPDRVVGKQWEFEHTRFSLVVESSGTGLDPLVKMTAWWHRVAKDDPNPARRFDVTIRCAGESKSE